MRRFRDRRPSTLFRGNELPRLATLVVMLGILVLMISRARDPGTWRWLAPDSRGESSQAPNVAAPETHSDDVVVAGPAASGPTDSDPQELDAAREEFQAVTDKAPLAKEEMAAYWRLIQWQQHQSLPQLRSRAKKDVTFKQLWQQPEKWRGQLVEIPLHLLRTAKVEDLEDNALGLKTMNEAWGWNSDSQPYSYWIVCPQLPPGMPSGQKILEEATFVGYFLKLLPYEDHQGMSRATPLLIGRLVWHPMADNPLTRSDEWTWPWFVAGGLAVLYVARWGARVAVNRAKGRASPSLPARADEESVAAWLAGIHEDPVADHEVSGNSTSNRPPPTEMTGPLAPDER